MSINSPTRVGGSRRFSIWVAFGILLSVSPIAVSPAQGAPPPEPGASRPGPSRVLDHVLVKLAPGSRPDQVLGKGSEKVMDRWHTHPVPPGKSPEEVVARLLTRPGVETADLDYELQVEPLPDQKPLAQAQSPSVNDPYLSYQWHLPAVQASHAWTTSTGSGVVVAVVDSGVSKGSDLACHNFVAPYNAITQKTGATAASDDTGHGTHVAGTVAQCTDNGVGVAGVAFGASLMPVKVLDSDGSGRFSWIARGIDWARANGADVINLSLGCDGCSSTMVNEAIEAAHSEEILIVAAAGNSNKTSVSYPANHPDVIAVGATDYNNARAPYSNRGSALDLAAPGGNKGKDANGDGYPDGVLQETFGWAGWGYYFHQGTSMATPHVAGAAALLLSESSCDDPARVRRALEETALDLGPAGFDMTYGHGLIQIDAALAALTSDDAAPSWSGSAKPSVSEVTSTSVKLTWGAASDDSCVTGYRIYQDNTLVKKLDDSRTVATISGLDPATQYVFEVRAVDAAGNLSQPSTVKTTTLDEVSPKVGLNPHEFDDIAGHTFYGDILWMSGSGITRGCNPPVNDLFCPDDPVTRGQMAAFLVRALGLTQNSHPGFDDVASSSTFVEDIGKLATAGVTRGCNPPVNDLFCPEDSVTRGQLAAFLRRALG
jgi:serine protease